MQDGKKNLKQQNTNTNHRFAALLLMSRAPSGPPIAEYPACELILQYGSSEFRQLGCILDSCTAMKALDGKKNIGRKIRSHMQSQQNIV